jgi:bacterioferritin-associated ferredoxin
MYVCLCNGFTDRELRSAAEPGCSVADAYRALGVRPKCGKCAPTVKDIVRGSDAAERRVLTGYRPHA